MQGASADARGAHRLRQRRVGLEATVPDAAVYPGEVLVDDPAGTQVEVTDLRVALLPGRQPDRFPGRRQRGVGPATQERLPVGLPGGSDGVAEWIGADSPTVDDDEQQERGPPGHALRRSPGERGWLRRLPRWR